MPRSSIARHNAVKRYRAKYPDRVTDQGLRRKYGITLAQRDALLTAQDGRCAICGCVLKQPVKGRIQPPEAINVDHNHTTGQVRGLLCRFCNTALGFFGDSTGVVRSALHYLEKNKNAQIPTV